MSKSPSFFIVGAPKCGTSSLYRYLEQHPDIFLPVIKEPNYFAKDLGILTYPEINSIASYLELYQTAEDKAICGDASQFHLYSQVAPKAIYDFCPEAKIIIMLREPAAMVNSLHAQYLSTGDEDNSRLHEVLALESKRLQGECIPPRSLFPKCMAYQSVASYAQQVKRYFEIFPENSIKIILLDELVADVHKVYLDTLEFLGVEIASVPLLQPYNAARASKQMPEQLKHHLRSEFEEEVSELESLIGRDLSSWKNAANSSSNLLWANR